MNQVYGVLGAYGFLGKHIMQALTTNGIIAIGGSRRNGVDANSRQQLIAWIESNHITHIINAAAECGGIGLNRARPADLWASTTRINATVLAACAQRVRKLTMIGTVCSYSANNPIPFKEEHLMHYGPPETTNAAYGVAKLSGLYGAQAYRKQYGLNAIYLLPVNLYGPGDNFDERTGHVIPALIRKISNAKKFNRDVTVWGTGTATREFLYVQDAAAAIIAATQKYDGTDPINIGAGFEISINDLVNLIAKQLDYHGRIHWDNTHPDGQMRRSLDTTLAHEQFDWKASTKFEDGLARTIEWYLSEV